MIWKISDVLGQRGVFHSDRIWLLGNNLDLNIFKTTSSYNHIAWTTNVFSCCLTHSSAWFQHEKNPLAWYLYIDGFIMDSWKSHWAVLLTPSINFFFVLTSFAQNSKRKHNARINVFKKPWNVQKNELQNTQRTEKKKEKKNENKILQEYIRQQQRDNEIHKNECDFGCSLSLYYVRGDIFLECCCCCGGGCCCIYILPCWYQTV